MSLALQGQLAQVEDVVLQREDQTYIFRVQATPIWNDRHEITHALVVFEDITLRKRAALLLANYNATLEQEVQKRTLELEQVNQELRLMAHMDGLTRVANRRQFNQRLQEVWQELGVLGQSLAVLFVDVDYFKHYNDRYGHQQGDTCLVKIAQSLKQTISTHGLVARYGGEEFVVLLPRITQEMAIPWAETLRQAVEALVIPHDRSQVSSIVTISIGIAATIPRLDQSPESLLQNADKALYRAKAAGRNSYHL